MLKAYAFGFFGAALAVVLVAVILFGTKSSQEPGLLWGDKVYTTRQEFDAYLKSKGLSYKTWAARYPGAAPWEPDEITIGAITVRASTETREAWVVRLPLAAAGLMLATGCALLLLRGLRTAMPSRARGSVAFVSAVLTVLLASVIWFGTPRLLLAAIGLTVATGCALLLPPELRPVPGRLAMRSVAFFRPWGLQIGKSAAAGAPTAFALVRRLGVAASVATRRLKASAPLVGERLIGAARADARLPTLMRERNISVGDVAFGVLAVVTAVIFALFVVLLFSR